MKYIKIENGMVIEAIEADETFFTNFIDSTPGEWVDAREGVGIGYAYNINTGVFIPPRPFESWVLDNDTCQWEPPVNYPEDDKIYEWDEATTSWTETINQEEV
jgi:hypothetical protein